jgi:membrane protein required for colicin V production
VNVIDVFFILLFIGSLALGFFQGMIRLVVLIVALYLSLVLASLYYTAVGEWLVVHFNAQRYVGQYMGFAIVLFVGFLLLAAAGVYTFRYASLPGGLEYVDRVIGLFLGMLLGAFFLGTFAVLLYNLMIVRGGSTIDFPIMRALGSGVANSFMLRYFATTVLPLVYSVIDPALPEGANLIFRPQ